MAFRDQHHTQREAQGGITVLTGVFLFHGNADHITGIHKTNQLEKKVHAFRIYTNISITFINV